MVHSLLTTIFFSIFRTSPQAISGACRSNEGPNDRREGARGAVDHPGAPTEGAADETHDPSRVESDGGLDVGHEGEGNLGFLIGEFG